MEIRDKVVAVTGAAGGIGRALALRFASEGARAIAVIDRDGEGAARVASEIGERATAPWRRLRRGRRRKDACRNVRADQDRRLDGR